MAGKNLQLLLTAAEAPTYLHCQQKINIPARKAEVN